MSLLFQGHCSTSNTVGGTRNKRFLKKTGTRATTTRRFLSPGVLPIFSLLRRLHRRKPVCPQMSSPFVAKLRSVQPQKHNYQLPNSTQFATRLTAQLLTLALSYSNRSSFRRSQVLHRSTFDCCSCDRRSPNCTRSLPQVRRSVASLLAYSQ
ncbi:hypothetical protein PLICRDRAFT_225770 [Plicaturopsis crispa FD-325 SS-3]|nr:hypothetical protein PLICRDRAFT_225770 [Plicaturopsis crispa FD-325 SS-3]